MPTDVKKTLIQNLYLKNRYATGVMVKYDTWFRLRGNINWASMTRFGHGVYLPTMQMAHVDDELFEVIYITT